MGVTRPGKRLQKNDGKITMFLMGKSTISIAIFNSFLYVYQGVYNYWILVEMTCECKMVWFWEYAGKQ